MDTSTLLEHLTERFKWNSYNFILCIPLNLTNNEYENIYKNFSKEFPDNELFDRKTLHISFGRFKIKNLEELNDILNILQKIKIENPNISEKFFYSNNKFGNFNRYFSLYPLLKFNNFNSLINKYFSISKKYHHDNKPHTTIGMLNKNVKFNHVDKINFINKKISINDLRIIAVNPITDIDNEDEYITLNKVI